MNKVFIALSAALTILAAVFLAVYFIGRTPPEQIRSSERPSVSDRPKSTPEPSRPPAVPKSAPAPAKSASVRSARESVPPPGCVVEGQVVRADDGKPVPAFGLRFDARRARGTRREAVDFVPIEEASGAFKLEGLSAGNGVIVVRAEGFAEARQEVALEHPGDIASGLVIRLQPIATIDGLVRDASGTAVTGALVFLDKLPSERLREQKTVAESDDNGRFRYETPDGQAITFAVWHEDYAPAFVSISAESGVTTECTVTLGRGAVVEGKVWYGDTPLADETIVFRPQFDELGFEARAHTDASGAYRFEALPTCDALVAVTLSGENQGGRSKQWTGLVEEGQTLNVDFRFTPADASVEGNVTLDDQAPESATLSLLIATDAGEEGRTTLTGADGAYRFDAVPQGFASLTVTAKNADGKLGFSEMNFKIKAGEEKQANFFLGVIEGSGMMPPP